MKSRSAQLTLTAVCLVLGILLMMQLRTQGKLAKSIIPESALDQTTMISSLYESNLALRREAETLAANAREYDHAQDDDRLQDMVAEVSRLRILNGQSEVTGPGIELIVQANLRAEDVQDLINELRNAGAEAASVGDQRIVARTAVSTYRGKVVVNNTFVEPPFVFRAVGHPDTLDRALARKGGLLAYLHNAYPTATITLTKQGRLALPSYGEQSTPQYARPVEP
ncbi:MAG: DUF881 domain-containing protein [Chloroflexi bacterium]|nr:DUF881 domain-containing protein [Chloroflexota bacterium]